MDVFEVVDLDLDKFMVVGSRPAPGGSTGKGSTKATGGTGRTPAAGGTGQSGKTKVPRRKRPRAGSRPS